MTSTTVHRSFWPSPPELRLTPLELANLCYHAGNHWRDPKTLETAVAIAIAESGGDVASFLLYVTIEHKTKRELWTTQFRIGRLPRNLFWVDALTAVSPPNFSNTYSEYADIGVFAISTKWNPNHKEYDLFNEFYNIRYAQVLFKEWGLTFEAWTTYNSGRYKAFLPQAKIGVDRLLALAAAGRLEPIPNPAHPGYEGADTYLPPLSSLPPGPARSDTTAVSRFGRRWWKADWESYREALSRHGSSWRLWAARYPEKAKQVFGK